MVNSRPSSIKVRTEGPTITTIRMGQVLDRAQSLNETNTNSGTAPVIINPDGLQRLYIVYILISQAQSFRIRLNIGGYDTTTNSFIPGTVTTLLNPTTMAVASSGANAIGYTFQTLGSRISLNGTRDYRFLYLIRFRAPIYLQCFSGGTTVQPPSYIDRYVSFIYPILRPPPPVTSRFARYGTCIERLGTVMNGRTTQIITAPSAPFTIPNSNGRTFSVVTANPGGAEFSVQLVGVGSGNFLANYLTPFTYTGYSVTFPPGGYTLAVISLDPVGESSYGRGQTAGSWTYYQSPTVKETYRLGSDMSATQSLYLQSFTINGTPVLCKRGIPTFTPP